MKAHALTLGLCLLLIFGGRAIGADKNVEDLPFAKQLQLAKAGDPDARLAVALDYELGLGVTLDEAEAAKWYRLAALNGSMEAQFRLGKLVSKGAPRLKADKATAYKLFLTAAQRGHAPSQNEVGLMMQNGMGTPKDENGAVVWYRKAAAQGFPAAENNLGVMLLSAQGTDRNVDEAFKLFTRAAEKNDAWGLNNLGAMYQKGWGTSVDLNKARLNYKKAADLGNETARANLEKLDIKPAGAALKQ